MICKNNSCKAELPDDATFCLKCGTKQNISEPTELADTQSDTTAAKPNSTSSKKKSVIITIIVIVLIACIVIGAIFLAPKIIETTTQPPTTETTTTEIEEERVFSLSKCPVKISGVYTSAPNSVGGVDLILYWENTANNDIKYIYVYVTPYNRVGDVETSDIGNKKTAKCRLVGPYETGDGGRAEFETVWYNSMISYAKVDMIEIEYMGGWIETFVN